MEKSDNSEQLGKIALETLEDIPQAFREQKPTPKVRSFPKAILFLGLGLGAIALIVGSSFWWESRLVSETPIPETPEVKIGPAVPEVFPKPDNLLGHLPYSEAPVSDLKSLSGDGRFKMRTAAAQKFLQMQAEARRSGIILEVISAFRSVEEQQRIFFQVKEQRGQGVEKRAEVSAPPGYSEHHTGYAIDIGDARFPDTHLSVNFENTPAFKWLEINAPKYSFELSFPKDNLQGVNYEPWHWRFVGDRHSLETFYKAQNLSQQLK